VLLHLSFKKAVCDGQRLPEQFVSAIQETEECGSGPTSNSQCSLELLQRSMSKSSEGNRLGDEDLSAEHLQEGVIKKSAVSTGLNHDSLGGYVSLNEQGHLEIAATRSDADMAIFIERVVSKLGGVITNKDRLQWFAQYYSGRTGVQAYHRLLNELRQLAKMPNQWVRLPPPEAGVVLWKMIRTDLWVCGLLPPGDPRRITCDTRVDSDSLQPRLLNCAKDEHICNIEHANAFRTNFAIGALPCCNTPPFCAAPTCKNPLSNMGVSKTCTRRSVASNLAYLRRSDAWPAYHGWGNSFLLDSLKFVDVLGCQDNTTGSCSVEPFDLVLDIGAGVGEFTERLTTRNFAKDYVMIEGNPVSAKLVDKRFFNPVWRSRWWTEQVPHRDADEPVNFHVLRYVLGNKTGDQVDMCNTAISFSNTPDACFQHITTLDTVIPQQLSTEFQEKFAQAGSLFLKIDTDGMDELVIGGMPRLLQERRGQYKDGSPRHLVNFLQFSFVPSAVRRVKHRDGIKSYDLKSVSQLLEDFGFESFLVGPRYLPLSHGSWNDAYMETMYNPDNNAGVGLNYPDFDGRICPWCASLEEPSFAANVVAIRSNHPRAQDLMIALGACDESKDFNLADSMYDP